MTYADMKEGYLDGLDPESPTPSTNRSASYCHGFANGRADLLRKPRGIAADLRREAAAAIKADAERSGMH